LRFNGKTLAFEGDSQVREFVHNVAMWMSECCQYQLLLSKKCTDKPLCETIANAESYPSSPQIFRLEHGDYSVTLLFAWMGHFSEATDTNRPSPSYFSDFVRGVASPPCDAFMMSLGHWDMTYRNGGKWGDNGKEICEKSAAAGKFLAEGAAVRPDILKKLIWRMIYPDELDCWPKPGHPKWIMRPWEKVWARECTYKAIGSQVKTWDVWEKMETSAEKGKWDRAYLDTRLTIDGLHPWPEVNVELSWELFSFWSENVV
jgi:hypothetical protein